MLVSYSEDKEKRTQMANANLSLLLGRFSQLLEDIPKASRDGSGCPSPLETPSLALGDSTHVAPTFRASVEHTFPVSDRATIALPFLDKQPRSDVLQTGCPKWAAERTAWGRRQHARPSRPSPAVCRLRTPWLAERAERARRLVEGPRR